MLTSTTGDITTLTVNGTTVSSRQHCCRQDITSDTSSGMPIDMHRTTLVDALSTSPYVTLVHLRTIYALTSTTLPTSQQNISETTRTARLQALSTLLLQILPLVSLSSAIGTHGSQRLSIPIHSLLQAIQANATLPSVLPSPPLPQYIHPHLAPLADPTFDDASTALAQAASTDVDELTELWNRLIPDHMTSSSDQLPRSIQSTRAAIALAHESSIRMDALVARTRAAALTALHDTLRNALNALETDTMKRAEEPSAEYVYARLLCARGRAVAAKLKLLRAEIAAAMYTPECARALRVIANEIKSRFAGIESQLVDKRLRLRQYRALGVEYLQVAGELAKAKSLLEHKLWTRHELNIE